MQTKYTKSTTILNVNNDVQGNTYTIGNYNPSVRIKHKRRTSVGSERQIFEKPLMTNLYTLRFLPEIWWEQIAEEILFVFYFDVWSSSRRGLVSSVSAY